MCNIPQRKVVRLIHSPGGGLIIQRGLEAEYGNNSRDGESLTIYLLNPVDINCMLTESDLAACCSGSTKRYYDKTTSESCEFRFRRDGDWRRQTEREGDRERERKGTK